MAEDPSKTKKPSARVSQSDVPRHGLDDALRVAQAIADEYGKKPTPPLGVAKAMGLQPLSSNFRTLAGAAIAYGLTEGGYNAKEISLTELGRRIVAPTVEGDDAAGKREAFLRPRVIREFLTRYSQSKWPSDKIAANVLEGMGVDAGATTRVLKTIGEGALALGFLTDIKGTTYVDLSGDGGTAEPGPVSRVEAEMPSLSSNGAVGDSEPVLAAPPGPPDTPAALDVPGRGRRVFISHGRNKKIVEQVKELLAFGEFEPIVSVERETTSKPVPDKVLDDMRSCGAGVIHVGTEKRLIDADGEEHHMLNQNVLIEIGAAMALFGRKFILLVERGATLPSNLQGLYEVRYEGAELDHDATIKLLKAFKDFKE